MILSDKIDVISVTVYWIRRCRWNNLIVIYKIVPSYQKSHKKYEITCLSLLTDKILNFHLKQSFEKLTITVWDDWNDLMLNRTGIEASAVQWTLFSYFEYHWSLIPVFYCCCIHRVTTERSFEVKLKDVWDIQWTLWKNLTSKIYSFCHSGPKISCTEHFRSSLTSIMTSRQCWRWSFLGKELGLKLLVKDHFLP